MQVIGVLFSALLLSALVIAGLVAVAPQCGLTDAPGGHKRHDVPVPLVGGVSLYVVLVAALAAGALLYPDMSRLILSLLLASTLLFAVGLADDVRPLPVSVRFLSQGVAALLAVVGGGLLIEQLGVTPAGEPFRLGSLALPFTLFAIVGVINSMNMIDGIDGLSGSLSLISLGMLSLIAANSASAGLFLLLALALIGAVCGFLAFNLRCCGRDRAVVFMGDAGSTLLGFTMACLLIALSQAPVAAMSPMIAPWLLAVPLFDAVATMLRRVWLGRSPFHADRSHLHHQFLDAGFSVQQVVTTISGLQLLLGAVGLAGWYWAWPDMSLFVAYIGLFGLYFYVTSRPWRLVPRLRALHRYLELPMAGVSELFIGDLPEDDAEQVLRRLLGDEADTHDYRIYVYDNSLTGRHTVYAVAPLGHPRLATRMIRDIRTRIGDGEEIVVRQFVPRDETGNGTAGHVPERRGGRSYPYRTDEPGSRDDRVDIARMRGLSEYPVLFTQCLSHRADSTDPRSVGPTRN